MTTVDGWFDGKASTREIFDIVRQRIERAGSSEMTVGSQISFGNARKFAWFWLYNVTSKTPDGVLHLMLAIDEEVDDPHVRNVEQISAHRWNHQIVIRTKRDARSAWLGRLITQAYAYGERSG